MSQSVLPLDSAGSTQNHMTAVDDNNKELENQPSNGLIPHHKRQRAPQRHFTRLQTPKRGFPPNPADTEASFKPRQLFFGPRLGCCSSNNEQESFTDSVGIQSS